MSERVNIDTTRRRLIQGSQIWTQSGLGWLHMGQIQDLFSSDFSTFCAEKVMDLSHLWLIWPTFGPNLPSVGCECICHELYDRWKSTYTHVNSRRLFDLSSWLYCIVCAISHLSLYLFFFVCLYSNRNLEDHLFNEVLID